MEKFCKLFKHKTGNALSDYHLISLGTFKTNMDLICSLSQYLLSLKLRDFIYSR